MPNFCSHCGAPVAQNARFCNICGQNLAVNVISPSYPAKPQQNTPAPARGNFQQSFSNAVNTMQTLRHKASSAAGVIPVNDFGKLPESALRGVQAAAPAAALFGTVGSYFRGIGQGLKSKKGFLWAVFMAIVWVVLTLLGRLYPDNFIVKALSWLTLARGGTSGSFLQRIGGILGKGAFASASYSFLSRGPQKIISAVRSLGGAFKNSGSIGSVLIGIGVSLPVCAFFSGGLGLSGTMASVSVFMTSVMSMGSRNGWLYKFAGSCTSVKRNKFRSANRGRISAMLTGISLGAALSVPLLTVSEWHIQAIAAAVLIPSGAIAQLIFSRKQGGETA